MRKEPNGAHAKFFTKEWKPDEINNSVFYSHFMLALGWKWSLSLLIPKFIGSNPAMDTKQHAIG